MLHVAVAVAKNDSESVFWRPIKTMNGIMPPRILITVRRLEKFQLDLITIICWTRDRSYFPQDRLLGQRNPYRPRFRSWDLARH